MLRIDRKKLNAAIFAFRECAGSAVDTEGNKILWDCDCREAEKAILGALSIVGPGVCTASDVYFLTGVGRGDVTSFPPHPQPSLGQHEAS